jgi:tyrosine-protein kinase Etk/Wzc
MRRMLGAVLRYKWMVLGLVIVGSTLGVLGSRYVPPVYVAQATVWVPTQQRDSRGPIQQEVLFDSRGWIELLKTSFVVLDDVVRDLQLYLQPASPEDSAAFASFRLQDRFVPGSYGLVVSPDGQRFDLRSAQGATLESGRPGDSIGTSVGFAWQPPAETLRRGRELQFTVLQPRDAALQLQRDLQANIAERGANMLALRLEGGSPQRLAHTVNYVADGFVDTARALATAKHRQLITALSAQLDSAEVRLRNADMALEAFKVETITEPTERGTPVGGGSQETRSPAVSNFMAQRVELDGLRLDRDAVERALAVASDSGLPPDALLFIGSVQSSAELSLALKTLTERQADLRALRERYTEENPEVQRAVTHIRDLQRRTIPDMARGLLAQMAARERELETRVGAAARELRQIPRRATEEQRLTREVAIAGTAYQTLKARSQDAQFAESAGSLDARVLDRARVPQSPIRDTAQRLILMAVVGSLGLGVFGAVLLDRFDRHVRYPEQVSGDLGLPILGAIPRVKGAANGRPLARGDTAQVIEALRGVRLGLAHAYGAAGPMLVTITSPGPGEGKSFVVSNLALAFADAGHRTLLVDADVRRGELHRVMGASRKPGLTDYLQGNATRDDVLQTTRFKGLTFIGGGTRTPSAPELLASSALSELLLSVRSGYDVILLDSPPLGAGVDPYVLGTATGNLLLVLRTGVSDRELAEAKLDMLDRLPVRILGAVLNDVRPTGIYRNYSYNYYVDGYEVRSEADEDAADRFRTKGKKLSPSVSDAKIG